jgi:hypothetical protein
MVGLNAKPYHEQFQAKIAITDCIMPGGTRILQKHTYPIKATP